MRGPRYSEHVRKVLEQAEREALRSHSLRIEPEHVFVALLKQENSLAYKILQDMGVDVNELTRELYRIVPRESSAIVFGPVQPSERTNRVLDFAHEEARMMENSFVGTEHLLLGLLRDVRGALAEILHRHGITYENVYESVKMYLRLGKDAYEPSVKTPTLDNFAIDLTEKARKGELDPLIGREAEVERLVEVLSRKNKNNPVLVGPPGVGKTAIVEGLAQRIASEEVPSVLLGKRILKLDLNSVVAGTKYRGEFEERMKRIINEVKRAKNVIVFMDEIHTLIGAGSAEGSLDAGNILKPALARGEFRLIGATTEEEYRKYIEKDGALERRFLKIVVKEPTEDETLEILKGLRSRYEDYHGVRYSDEALEAAVRLSTRYISGRHLPDKAIDVIDEAGSRVKIKHSQRENDAVALIDKKMNSLRAERERAKSEGDVEKERIISRQIAILEGEKKKIKSKQGKKTYEPPVVTPEDIAETVSLMTGIPLKKLTRDEKQRLLTMEDELKKRVIGQDEAVKAVSDAVVRAKMGLSDPYKPLASFLFLGPTGVGKTELARALAEFLFGSVDALIKFDMSEYSDAYTVSKLIGSPPGYVGYEDSGLLVKSVINRPYSVVLFDEVEKAHPQVLNIFLQLLDEGRVTDARGRVADFRNTIVIMTSNIGSEEFFRKGGSLGFFEGSVEQSLKDKVLEKLKSYLPPELINRIDEKVVFRSLSKEDIIRIVELKLGVVKKKLSSSGITLKLSDAVKAYIAESGYDPKFGARHVLRSIQKNLEVPLSKVLLRHEDWKNGVVEVFMENEGHKGEREGGLVFKFIPSETIDEKTSPEGADGAREKLSTDRSSKASSRGKRSSRGSARRRSKSDKVSLTGYSG